MTAPGELYPTGVATMGGRGQQAPMPYPHALHTLVINTETTATHVDHFVTAEEAITARIRRLREMKMLHTRDGMTIRYMDASGARITLTYTESETA